MSTLTKKALSVGKFVNTEFVDTVVRTYKQERWKQNSERIGKEDSLSSWYSIEELERFIENAKENGGDGVRFYFAAYPEDYTAVPEYAGRQSFVMVATKARQTEEGAANKDIYVTNNGQSSILAYNRGHLCPPTCGFDRGRDGSEVGITIVDRGDQGVTIV